MVNLPSGGSVTIWYDFERLQKRCYNFQRLTHEKEKCPLLIQARREKAAEWKQRIQNEKQRLVVTIPTDSIDGTRKSKRKQRKMTQLMVRETQVDPRQEESESFKWQNLVTVVHLLSPFLNVRWVLALGWSVLNLPGYLFLREWEDVKGLQRR